MKGDINIMKKKRHSMILKLIDMYAIGTQEEMLEKLEENGFSSTQATVSRDIKELRLVKQMDKNGVYRYVEGKSETDEYLSKFTTIFSHSVVSSDYAGNMVVIKTRPGYASSIAYNIDNSDIPQILGTIAGDDTIFLVKKKGTTEEEIIDILSEVIPELNHRY